MAKHDRAKMEKRLRNAANSRRYRQMVCKSCGHKTSRPWFTAKGARCPQCKEGKMKPRRRAQ